MATTAEISTRVEAPAVDPHPFGLFAVAPPTDPVARWEAGVSWRSVACETVAMWTDPCIAGAAAATKDPTTDGCLSDITLKPAVVYSALDRSQTTLDEATADARAVVELGSEYAIETVLWQQLLDAAAAGTAPTAAADAAMALASVEQMLGRAYHGRGVIHMSRFTASLLGDRIIQDGDILTTRLGTPVVAGAGYEADLMGDPIADPSEITIFGTGTTIVHAGAIDILEHYDRHTNDARVIAERVFLAGWDCALVGRKATLT